MPKFTRFTSNPRASQIARAAGTTVVAARAAMLRRAKPIASSLETGVPVYHWPAQAANEYATEALARQRRNAALEGDAARESAQVVAGEERR